MSTPLIALLATVITNMKDRQSYLAQDAAAQCNQNSEIALESAIGVARHSSDQDSQKTLCESATDLARYPSARDSQRTLCMS